MDRKMRRYHVAALQALAHTPLMTEFVNAFQAADREDGPSFFSVYEHEANALAFAAYLLAARMEHWNQETTDIIAEAVHRQDDDDMEVTRDEA